MIRLPLIKNTKLDFHNLFLIPVFFISFFIYICFKIDPELYYQYHEPIFFFDTRFFNEFLSYPGGFVEYISAFLSQFYYYSWVGALIISVIAWLISLSTKNIIKSVGNTEQVQFIHLIPAILLLVLHSSYDHQLSTSIGLLISLGFFNLYSKIVPHKYLLKIILYLGLSVILYFVAGGQFFLFTPLCIILEISLNRSYSIGLFYVLIAAIIPYIAVTYFFIFDLEDAYLHSLAFEDYYKPLLSPYILYFYFPFIMISSMLYNRLVNNKTKKRIFKSTLLKSEVRYTVQILIIFVGGGLLLNSSFNDYKKTSLRVDYYAHRSDWKNVLKIITPEVMNDKQIAFQFNRALYHTGELPEKMFIFPQPAGSEGLILTREIGFYLPILRSDLYFELGYLNESQHWVCEALAVNGYTPRNLQRLALISILKGEDGIANKCLNLLDKTLLFRGWAKQYRHYIKNKSLIIKDIQLRKIKSLMPNSDFIALPSAPENDLRSLLQHNRSNKMAYEYMMAYYLLKRQLGNFIRNLKLFPYFGYSKIPRHYEEAILAYLAVKGSEKFNLLNYRLSKQTINDFTAFRKVLNSYGGDKFAAYYTIMAKYSNTYWAYLIYE
jgi:hypothetical protein